MFIVLLAVQVLFLNQIQFSGYINPFIYVLFIMLLPVNIPKYALMLLAFAMGISVDVFSNSLGVHSAASVFIAYLRPGIIRVITNREEDMNEYPGLAQTGWRWFLGYAILMVLLHHLALFYLEVFTFANFLNTLYRVILSSVFSFFVIVLSQFIIFRD
ncbi:rod shape-determining protein MreD [Maribellus sp. YY47]|uniref:rod shape-determining protein MreD n=1 Tax=Maribellus sp. YY47 TaxID=2929486 RepID=UPI0020016DEF|nr:rod shape-determining protein MreD [Maribellus sp. YY47]MCK3686274.1 rod shape-determining protein MreD [Maribellus sp. YY47]